MSLTTVDRWRGTAGRSRGPVYGLVGQVLNAGTNVVTAYVASLLLTPAEFGIFVLAFALVTLLLGAGRGLIGATLLVHLPERDAEDRERLVRSALGFTVVVGIGASALLAVAGAVGQPVLLWFVPWITVALLQDAGRYILLANRRPGAALVLDVAWALAQAMSTALGVWLVGELTLGVVATGWGIGALAGFVVFAAAHGRRPTHPRHWTRTTRDVAGWFTADAIVGQVELYLVLLLTGALLGAADVGGLRAVQLLAYQPAVVLLSSLLALLLPMAVRAGDAPCALRAVWRRATLATMPVVGVMALLGVLHGPLVALLFPQYVDYAGLVVPVVLQSAFLALGIAPLVVLRSQRRGATVLALGVARTVAFVVAAAVGAFLAGPTGLVGGLAVAAAAAWLLTALQARRHIAYLASGDAHRVVS